MRYELEHELQSRRDREEKLATKTGQVLIDWQMDGDQALAEKEAERPFNNASTTSTTASTTTQAHRHHQSSHVRATETKTDDSQLDQPSVSQQYQPSRKKPASITE